MHQVLKRIDGNPEHVADPDANHKAHRGSAASGRTSTRLGRRRTKSAVEGFLAVARLPRCLLDMRGRGVQRLDQPANPTASPGTRTRHVERAVMTHPLLRKAIDHVGIRPTPAVLGEFGMLQPGAAITTGCESRRQISGRISAQRHEIDRLAPFRRFDPANSNPSATSTTPSSSIMSPPANSPCMPTAAAR